MKRLFTPEEAEITLGLSMRPEPPPPIAERLGREAGTLAETLESMAKKGLIFRSSKGGVNYYMAAQFVVGIWEYHHNDLDEELIKDVNEYMPTLMKKSWLRTETKQLRVVPVAKSVSAEMGVMPFEAAEAIINKQSKIIVSPCICRKEQKMIGKGCDRLEEACLVFGAGAYYYEQNGLGREIDKQEALDLVKQGVVDPAKVVRGGISLVMEGRRVFEHLTVNENILVGSITRKDGSQNIRRDQALMYDHFPRLARVTNRLAGYCSGGEQQMIAIARALMSAPKMLMLDEPSLGLAPLLVKEIFEEIKRINQEMDTTLLIVEQNAKIALEISTYAYIMESGKIVLEGPSEELKNNPDVKEFYMGVTQGGGRKSFKEVKSYKRRKRWM